MYTPDQNRALPAVASFVIVAGGVAALVAGLAAHIVPQAPRAALAAVLTTHEKPEEPRRREVPAKANSTAAKGRPSPGNLRNKATQLVAPRPMLPPLIVPPPIVTTQRAGVGSASSNGASDRPGPGQGAGGIGDGLGSGGSGNGDGSGAGADDGPVTRPKQIRGRLRFADLPPDLREAQAGGELELQYRIGVDGRVSECRIRESSGRPDLDATTCRLITERFRFRPSRNGRGEPVASIMIERHGWYFRPEDEQP